MSQPKHKTDVHVLVIKTTDGQKVEVDQGDRLTIPATMNMRTAKAFALWHEIKKIIGGDKETK